MSGALYFTKAKPAQYQTAIRGLAQGTLPRPTHVDIHTNNTCNANCQDCIGQTLPKGSRPEQRLAPENIGPILDQVITEEAPPFIHFAGFTGDPLASCQSAKSVVEGILHLRERGLEEKTSIVTNGIGLAGNSSACVDHHGKEECSFPFRDLASYSGSIQINVTASYKHPLFEEAINELGLHQKIFGDTKIAVNFVLTATNNQRLPSLLDTLVQKKLAVNEVRLRIDLFERDNEKFQKRMIMLVEKLKTKHAESGLKIVMKSPPTPITADSFDRCISPFFWPAVGTDGQVYPCAHAVFPEFALGSLWEQTLDEILLAHYRGNWETVPECQKMCPSTTGNINLLGAEILEAAA